MAVVLITDIEDTGFNSYVSVANADAYFAKRYDAAAWAGSDDEKAQALLAAVAKLDAQNFIGNPISDVQPLAWPRATSQRSRLRIQRVGYGVIDLRQRFWAAGAIPQPIKDAQCELALSVFTDGIDNSAQADGLDSWKIGDVHVGVNKSRTEAGAISLAVTRLIQPFLAGVRLYKS